MEASKKLSPLMKHGILPPNRKLLVYRSAVQSNVVIPYGRSSPYYLPTYTNELSSLEALSPYL